MKTQKAMGVQWLQQELGWNDVRVPDTLYINSSATLEKELRKPIAYPLFARPCPVTPRHGFVDSRPVNNADEIRQVWNEARAADAEAELMLMQPVDAVASAILTPTMASIGPGNDGATSGKDGTVNVRLLYVNMPRPDHLIPEGTVPYAELVYSAGGTYAVQWRSGPPSDGAAVGGNYVPKDVTVQKVIRAHMLHPLELEEACKVWANLDGAVVWQAGGTPISHAAVHARLNGMAIVFDRTEPAIGTKLTATVTGQAAMCEEAFREELCRPQSKLPLPEIMPNAMLWAMHQGPALCESETGARFVARSAMAIWRYAATACIGEARHSRTTRNGRRRRRSPMRSAIYERALTKSPTSSYLRTAIKAAYRSFKKDNEFAGGFGGKAWAACTEAALKLYTALSNAANGTGTITDVVTAAHVVINMAHNNGYFLNKFAQASNFDAVASGNWQITAKALRDVFTIHTEPKVHGHVTWPLLRNRESDEERARALTCLVQWNLRSDGNVLHVQCGTLHNYKSANLPIAAIGSADREYILTITREKPAKFRSYQGSVQKYWRDALPASVLALINLNLQETNPNE